MIAIAKSCAIKGLAGIPVSVEADVANGLPQFTIVGLTDRAIQESRERVRAAIRNAGFSFPARRVTVNLAPAEIPKEGTSFDLPIAIALMQSMGHVLDLSNTALIGELALDGSVRPVAGVLPMARCLQTAGMTRVIVSQENAIEAKMVGDLEVFGVSSLADCLAHLDGSVRLQPQLASATLTTELPSRVDMADIRGQSLAKRALEIAAAGGHNLMMIGPPGSGKTMLAGALTSILPDLTPSQSLDVAAVYSLKNGFTERISQVMRPPFRAPHHSISRAGLIGGGVNWAQPGEISLAHRGVLFLDEICEFPRGLLESLRQPLEEGKVLVGRAKGSLSFPASFSLLAASNPCPCGYLGDQTRTCSCNKRLIDNYRAKLSGPFRDRIDMVVNVPRQSSTTLFGTYDSAESSNQIRKRVVIARQLQQERYSTLDVELNAELKGNKIVEQAQIEPAAMSYLCMAGEKLEFSARAFYRTLRLARTIADLMAAIGVEQKHVAEALQYREI